MALFDYHLGLKVDIPPQHLCPTFDSRLSYMKWVEGLVIGQSPRLLRGLDIGTGVCAVYPLILCARNSGVSMICTDVQKDVLESASRNIAQNMLADRIAAVEGDAEKWLIPPQIIENDDVDFVVMNPPFYQSREDILTKIVDKVEDSRGQNTGNRHEMETEGGEVGFVSRLVDESIALHLRHPVRESTKPSGRWFTSLLGHRSSLEALLNKDSRLQDRDACNLKTHIFRHGNTTRYCIAWQWKTTEGSIDD